MRRLLFIVLAVGVMGIVVGIGYYFFNTQKTSVSLPTLSSILSTKPVDTLPWLVDDCLVFNLPSCLQSTDNQQSEVNTRIVDTYIQASDNSRLLAYRQTYYKTELEHAFPNTTFPEMNPPVSHSIGQMIAYTSAVTGVNEKLLIAMMQANNNWWTSPIADNDDPFGIPVKGFFYQTMDAGLLMKRLYDMDQKQTITVVDKSDPSIKKAYTFASDINKGSIVVYTYLAQISSNPDDFEHRALLDYQANEINIRSIWSNLFGGDISANRALTSPNPDDPPEETIPPLEHLPIPEDIQATPRE